MNNDDMFLDRSMMGYDTNDTSSSEQLDTIGQ